MAGITRYKMAVDLLDKFKGLELHLNELKSLILKNLGSNNRTVKEYLELMKDTGLIHEIEHLRYKINGIE